MVLWQGWLYILEKGSEPGRITGDTQRPALGGGPGAARQPEIRWTDDGRILFLGESRGESYICQATAEGGVVRQLWGGGRLASGFSLDGHAARAVVASSTPASPSEVHAVDMAAVNIDDGGSALITQPNACFMNRQPAISLEKFSIVRAGYSIECRLWFPPHFDPAGWYPLVLDIHGGPNGAFYDSFVPWQQLLAGSGYLVLAVNPARLVHLRRRVHAGGAGRLGRRGLPGPHGRPRPRLPAQLRRRGASGHPRVQLRRLHDRLGHRPYRADSARRSSERPAPTSTRCTAPRT